MSTNLGLDGFARSKEDESLINQNINALFRTPNGKAVMKYLRSITIEAVTGPNVSDAELRHLEGQRYLVGLIERRYQQQEKAKQNERSR